MNQVTKAVPLKSEYAPSYDLLVDSLTIFTYNLRYHLMELSADGIITETDINEITKLFKTKLSQHCDIKDSIS